ncbi:MAG: biopolymer transport protein ExbD [Bacteriovoracaceae bacterium]|jgi:biopolymer transport protein ExbD
MARRKSKLNRKKEDMDVDITSLLDILVILLVFLLKSYNASDLKLEPAAKIELPSSASQALGRHSVIIQINSDKDIWIDNEKIGKVQAGGDQIEILLERLKKMKAKEQEQLRGIASETERKKKESKQVNLVLDQSLPYKVVRRVMHTSAMAGYPEFKFIVQGNF